MSNFVPARTAEIYKLRSEGKYEEAKKVRDKMVPYMDLAVKFSGKGGEYKVISLLKYMTDLVGSCGGWPRVPCIPLTAEEKKEAEKAFSELEL